MAKSILVTGASKGIGLAAAKLLAADGWSVIGAARSAPDEFPGEFVSVDLGDAKATAAFGEMLARRGSVLGIVNNVGAAKAEQFGSVDHQAFAELLDFNLRPVLQLTQALLPVMRAERFGRIVNITSLVTKGYPLRTSYAAAKAALESLTRTMAVENASYGVTANAVAPGPTETELFRKNNPPGSEGEKRYLSQIPMRRFGKPDELAATIAFLCSDGAGFLTGQTLFVDGGASLGPPV